MYRLFLISATALTLCGTATSLSAQKGSTSFTPRTAVERPGAGESVQEYLYTVVLVAQEGDQFQVQFEPSTALPAGKEKAASLRRSQDEINSQPARYRSESDILNLLASRGMELVSVLPSTESGKQVVKYYFKTRLTE